MRNRRVEIWSHYYSILLGTTQRHWRFCSHQLLFYSRNVLFFFCIYFYIHSQFNFFFGILVQISLKPWINLGNADMSTTGNLIIYKQVLFLLSFRSCSMYSLYIYNFLKLVHIFHMFNSSVLDLWYLKCYLLKSNNILRPIKMIQWVKSFATQAWCPDFNFLTRSRKMENIALDWLPQHVSWQCIPIFPRSSPH